MVGALADRTVVHRHGPAMVYVVLAKQWLGLSEPLQEMSSRHTFRVPSNG
jgi:hypothetical protein